MSKSLQYRLVFGLVTMFSLPVANAAVITQLQGKNLHVMGDSQINQVTITANSDTVTVTSADTDPSSVFTVAMTKVRKIIVGTMAGDDDISFESSIQPGDGSQDAIDVDVHAGAGEDMIRMTGYWGRADIHAARGKDKIEIGVTANAKFDGQLNVYGGRASDQISLQNVAVAKKTRIRGGAGGDVVFIVNNNFVKLFRLRTGGGDDTVTFIDNIKRTSAPFKLRGGAGTNDSLSGKFDLDEMQINGFEEVIQIPDDPILITNIDRATSVRASYSDTAGPPPNNVINELEQSAMTSNEAGPWDVSLAATILESYVTPAPIQAFASQVSDIGVSGGTLDIDLFSDRYWGSQPDYFRPFGSARSASNYEVNFLVNEDVTLTVDGFLSTNRSSSVSPWPLGFAAFRLIERGQSDVTLVQHIVSPTSDVMFNDLVENLDGTSIVLQAGKSYSVVVTVSANSSATFEASNSEAEVSLVWNITSI